MPQYCGIHSNIKKAKKNDLHMRTASAVQDLQRFITVEVIDHSSQATGQALTPPLLNLKRSNSASPYCLHIIPFRVFHCRIKLLLSIRLIYNPTTYIAAGTRWSFPFCTTWIFMTCSTRSFIAELFSQYLTIVWKYPKDGYTSSLMPVFKGCQHLLGQIPR